MATIIRHRIYDRTHRLVASFADETDQLRIATILRERGHVSEIRTEHITIPD